MMLLSFTLIYQIGLIEEETTYAQVQHETNIIEHQQQQEWWPGGIKQQQSQQQQQ